MSITTVNRQTAAVPPVPAAQKQTADQFTKLTQQARMGDSKNAKEGDGGNTAVKSDQSKVQSRGQRDQGGQGEQHHQGMTRRVVNGQLVISKDGHVTSRLNVGGNLTTGAAGLQNLKMQGAAQISAFEQPRIQGQALPLANNIVPTQHFTSSRSLDSRSSRVSETGKTSADFGTAVAGTVQNAEAAVQGQQNGEDSSGDGDHNDDQGTGTPSGTLGEDGAAGNTGDIGSGGGQPPGGRTGAAGAAPEEPEEPDEIDGLSNLGGVDGETRLQTIEEWRAIVPFFALTTDEDNSISSLLADIELLRRSEDQDVQDDQQSFIARLRVPLKLLASYVISSYQDGALSNPPGCGLSLLRTPVSPNPNSPKLSPDEAFELMETLLESKIDSPDRERLILNSIDFILNYASSRPGGFYESEDDLREAFALTTRHDIADHDWDPNHHMFLLSALSENRLYQASSVQLIRSPERDRVMEYFASSADDPSRKANIIAVMIATALPADEAARKLDSGDATLAEQLERFLLTGKWRFRTPFANEEQNAAITSRFVDLELSRPSCDFDMVPLQMFDTANIPLKNRLKELADFLVTGELLTNHGRQMPAQLSVEEASDLIESLVESKSNIDRPEVILSNCADFIKRYRYTGDSDKVSADYREAFALARTYDIAQPISSAVTLLSQNNVDLLNVESRDAVMAYFVSSSDENSRKAAVAAIMVTRGVSASEAARSLDSE